MSRIDTDWPCTICGYNLVGRGDGEQCPECNTPVARSLDEYNTWSATGERPSFRRGDLGRKTRRFMRPMCVLSVAAAVLVLIMPGFLGASLDVTYVLYVLAAFMCTVYGVIFFVLSRRADQWPLRMRRGRRCGCCRYDLQGCPGPRCPECGVTIRAASS